MTYANPNTKTLKDLQTAIEVGYPCSVFEPGLGTVPLNGKVHLEGPHAPRPHKWYGVGVVKDGKLISVS